MTLGTYCKRCGLNVVMCDCVGCVGAGPPSDRLDELASAWEAKAAWLYGKCGHGSGAVARANAYRECAAALRALAPRPPDPAKENGR